MAAYIEEQNMASVINIESNRIENKRFFLKKVEKVSTAKSKTLLENLSSQERKEVNNLIDKFVRGTTSVAEERILVNMGLLTKAKNELTFGGISEHGMAMLDQVQAELSGIMQNPEQMPSTNALKSRWAEFVSEVIVKKGGMVDINSLVQMVLREAYLENTQDLHFYAQKVRYFNEVKKAMREELTRAREILTDNAGREETQALVGGNFLGRNINTEAFSQPESIVGDDGSGGTITTKAELDTYITNLEETLNSVGDDAQLANVDLQNMLQKQQQTLQMMSNISKMLHDTSMAVIRKIGS